MKTKSLLLALLSIVIYCYTFGQDTTKSKPAFKQTYKWGVGVGAGFTTGFGISIKYQPRKDGIQLNFIPFIDNASKQKLICVGLAYTHDLWNDKLYNNFHSVYFYMASSLTYQETKEWSYYSYSYSHNISNPVNSGLGFGFETFIRKRIFIDIMVGYAQYDTFKQLFLTGEIALHYKFSKSK